MNSLKSKLKEWAEAGLIAPAQEKSVWDYERRRAAGPAGAGRRLSGLHGFLILSALIMGLGAVSLTAANWRLIPAFAKLSAYFAGLGALAVFCWKAKARPASWSQPLLVFYMISAFAGIALISQIYNAEGALHQALFFWAVVTFSLMLRAGGAFPVHFYLAGLYAAFVLWSLKFWPGMGALAAGEEFYGAAGGAAGGAAFKAQALPPLLLFAASLPLPPPAARLLKPLAFLSAAEAKKAVFQSWAALTGLVSLGVFSLSRYPSLTDPDQGARLVAWDFFFMGLPAAYIFLSLALSPFQKQQKVFSAGAVLAFLLLFALSLIPWDRMGGLQWDAVRLAALSMTLLLVCLSALSLRQNNLFAAGAAAFVFQAAFFCGGALAAPAGSLFCFGFFMLCHHPKVMAAFPLPSAKKAFAAAAAIFGLFSLLMFSKSAGGGAEALKTLFGLKGLVFAAAAGFAVYAAFRSAQSKKAQKILLSWTAALFCLSSALFLLAPPLSSAYQLASLILNGAVLSLIAVFALTLKAKGFFILCLAALMCRILLFYFEFAKGLAAAGAALLLCGAGLAAAGRLFEKYRGRISAWADRLDDGARGGKKI